MRDLENLGLLQNRRRSVPKKELNRSDEKDTSIQLFLIIL